MPEDSSEEEVLDYISRFNEESSVHGIHIQLPLPRHMDKEKILNAVRVEEDVNGFSSLKTRDQEPPFKFPSVIPCTAKGCIELLYRCEIRIKGNSVVVIGNGSETDIVAPPVAYLLERHGANKVTLVHRGTENLAEIVKQADILICAAERAYVVRGRWIKPGAVVIDTGNNRIIDQRRHLGPGYRFVGDV
ncbi:bifunctional protein FolD 4, chloroplastic-like [Papaver somniferum]|uniref:bifunctional protein FolD 4, chloroplastic-like n=1 Tax=Papaver somniferum TaxID=3469 RepID=UPI000E70467A|nr:bifunctional protein FolD 4, chloroplastic-like [Papaver somniferum]